MNLNKHLDFFNPISDLKTAVHIIGCGAIGSHLAEMMVRMGIENIHLYDFDTVTAHNIPNQIFTNNCIGKAKTEALLEQLIAINPAVKDTITIHDEGYISQALAGYVFLAVDNIDLRREIATSHQYNSQIKAMFDFRMRLVDAQHYGADWSDPRQVKYFLNSMNFTHEEAKIETPVSACGTSLNVISTVRMITAAGLSNFINFVKRREIKKLILIDAFMFTTDAF